LQGQPDKGMTDAARKVARDFNKKGPAVHSTGNHDYKKGQAVLSAFVTLLAEWYLWHCLYKRKYFLNYK
jgi:hypothetical protein